MDKELDEGLKLVIKDIYFSYDKFDKEEGAARIAQELKWDYGVDTNEDILNYAESLYKE